ncbi:S8 family serine peptidase [Nonomuraea maritima]|uniref:S8 family serine peptidase n=1 Tax=Nonomuraea maritima TaxID=683260 RepID=UPI00371DFD5A
MLQKSALLTGVLSALLAAVATPAQAAPTPSPTAAAPAGAAAAQSPKTVTLITGDTITLRVLPDRRTQVDVKPGPGRENVQFMQRRGEDGLTVVPMDALPLLAQDRLDPRLFNVTRLVELGYDDATSPALPLITTYPQQVDVAAMRVAGGRPLPAVHGVAASEPRSQAGTLWKSLTAPSARAASAPAKIWLDGKAKLSLDVSVPHIGAPTAWSAGHTGEGVTVAVLDGGYDPGHPDLKGLVVKEQNFTAEPDIRDLYGHGTHVASTIAGTGAASGGRYKGVAPGAKLMVGKVCQQDGSCPDSAIIEGMTWAAQNGADIANLSLGGPDAPGLDPLEQAVENLSDQYGTLFVIAAGNDGPGTLGSPGSADHALTVGASNREVDVVAPFSGTGPRQGDAAVKPDLVAPGVGIVAARAADTWMGAPVDEWYTGSDGTSMATPHVAGAAAIVASAHPDWTGQQIKAALMASTAPGEELGAYVQGSGRVDVARAVGQQITTEPAALSLGEVELPRSSAKGTLTYRNDGDAAVRLALSVVAKDGHGETVTPFTLGAGSVEVPAHGTAQVEVTAEAGALGTYSGTVIAQGDGVSVRTGIGMRVEPQKQALKLAFRTTDGQAPVAAFAGVIDLETEEQVNYDVYDGKLDLRLPKDRRYTVVSLMLDDDGSTVMAADPVFTLTDDRTVTADARKAEPVDVRVEEPSARIAFGMVGMLQLAKNVQPLGVDIDLPRGGDRVEGVKAIPNSPVKGEADRSFGFYRWTQWAEQKSDGTFDDSPYIYHLMKAEPRIPADPGYRPKRGDLAQLTATYGAQQDGKYGEHFALPALYGKELAWMPYGGLAKFALPFHRTEYYTPGDTGWYPSFVQYKPDPWDNLDQFFFGRTTEFRAGQKLEQSWNTGVFAPAVSAPGDLSWREGDVMQFGVGLFDDPVTERYSLTSTAEASTTVLRDGKEVFAADYLIPTVDVPADAKESEYRVSLSATRDPAASQVSTKVSAEWRFRSKTPAQGKREPLPLMAVRIAPELDDRNQAKRGHLRIPLTLQRPAGTPDHKVTTMTLEVSYDDGRTWQPAKVRAEKDNAWTAEVTHPGNKKGAFVSLRLKAADAGGNGFSETVTRAYRIK